MLGGKAALECSGDTWEQMFAYEEPLSGFLDETQKRGQKWHQGSLALAVRLPYI